MKLPALRVVQSSQRIDLLVTDIGLTDLNGRQLADAAREKRQNLKVLFIMGYADREIVSESGMEIITEPFATDVLANRIREMIEKKSLSESSRLDLRIEQRLLSPSRPEWYFNKSPHRHCDEP